MSALRLSPGISRGRVTPIEDSGRTCVIGILNVTPDSFSDGGAWFDPAVAIGQGLRLRAEGADIIDVGGESTRPGADRPELAEELRRVIPVVAGLVAAGCTVSTDTMRADVAVAAVAAGAGLVNDVSGGLADPRMLTEVARVGVPYVCMHWRAHSAIMQTRTDYADVVTDVRDELAQRVTAALAAGIEPGRLILDPGIGFAKNADHNWALLRRLDELSELGYPLLLGVSRKKFLGQLLAEPGTSPPVLRPPAERDHASAALTTLLAARGIWGVRTHSLRQHRDAIAVVERMAPLPSNG